MASLENFELPQSVAVEEATATPRYAKFIAEPWQNGFGVTIGNALRRVLLSSIEGVAVSSIKIDGVSHEFSSIPGVMEDVMEIVLNVKKLKFSCDGTLPRTLELYAEKAGPVTAANIREDGATHVLNPEQLICTLDRDQPFRMDLELNKGRGYTLSEDNKHEDQAIGTIPVDSLYSPIERVRYDVQACRVGQHTDFDRLELEIWTDGRVDPREALTQAALILREHLQVFTTGESGALFAQNNGGLTEEERKLVKNLAISINDLELSVRAVNCLISAQIHYLGELVEKSESQMLKYRNFGKKSLLEIKEKLQEYGLSLDMVLKDSVKEELMRQIAQQLQTTNANEE
ncbi:MAG: DNA-directed RNA polymerase subunit alpha [Lentisphaerae bacterium]|jgi:DNA-directed RNA polymerase subunit alpha|nr:DNA-directed RNA polymerase subunit alpha [Lentisphaerota bacterium]